MDSYWENAFTPKCFEDCSNFYENEMKIMLEWIQNVFNKKEKKILWINGESGSGKSTLANLFLKKYPLEVRMIHGASARTSKQLESWFELSNTYKNILQCFNGGFNTMAIIVEDMESFLLPSDRTGYGYFFQKISERIENPTLKNPYFPIICISRQSPLKDKKWNKWKHLCVNIELPKIKPENFLLWILQKSKENINYHEIPKEWILKMIDYAQNDFIKLKLWLQEIEYLNHLGKDFYTLSWSQVEKRILRVQPPKEDGKNIYDEELGVLQDWDGYYEQFIEHIYYFQKNRKTLAQCNLWYSTDPFFIPYGMFENMIRWMTLGVASGYINEEKKKEIQKNWNYLYEIYYSFVEYFQFQFQQFENNNNILDTDAWYSFFSLFKPWKIFHQSNFTKFHTPQYSWIYNKTSYTLSYKKKKNEFMWKGNAPFSKNWETECKTWISLEKKNYYSEKNKELLTKWSTIDSVYQWFNVFHLPIENEWKQHLVSWPNPNIIPWQYIPPKRKYERKKKKTNDKNEEE